MNQTNIIQKRLVLNNSMKFKPTVLFSTFFLLSILILPADVFSQQVKVDPFPIQSSTVLEDLKNLKTANPKISAIELAAAGNEMLDKKGLNFAFAFDAATCEKIKAAKAKQKDPNAPLKITAQLKSVEAETAYVVLPSIYLESNACGRCLTTIPLLEATAQDFITIIKNQNLKFLTPPNFIADEVFLLNNKSPNGKIRSWKVPFRTEPIGISPDDKIIYLDLPNSELKEIALLIFEEGVFQFYDKKDLDLTEKSVQPKTLPKSDDPNAAFVSFGTGDKTRILEYKKDCK